MYEVSEIGSGGGVESPAAPFEIQKCGARIVAQHTACSPLHSPLYFRNTIIKDWVELGTRPGGLQYLELGCGLSDFEFRFAKTHDS